VGAAVGDEGIVGVGICGADVEGMVEVGTECVGDGIVG